MTIYVYSLDNPEVNNPYSEEDYGSITSASTSSVDSGSITDSNPEFNFLEDDWYQITVTESLIPYGNLITLDSSQESATYQYVSSGILFEFTTQTITENVVFTWIGNGTVFEIGNGLERTVNAYLSSGTLRVDTTVAETALESFAIDPAEDTVLYTTTGISESRVIYQTPEDTQLFSVSGVDLESESKSYVGNGLATFSGSAEEKFTVGNYNTSGSLFSLNTAQESITFDYNESSIQTGNVVDYGNIVDYFSGVAVDYGQVSEDIDPKIDDFEFVINQVIPITYPFGGMSLSGSAICAPNYRLYIDGNAIVKVTYSEVVSGSISLSSTVTESETESYVGFGTLTFSGSSVEKNTESYVGLGTLTFSGLALESYSAQTPEDVQLFVISGTSLKSETESYISSGTLFGFGNLIESITYSYNESSITEGALDYGLVSNAPELFDNYNSLSNGGPTVDFGEISVVTSSIVGELIYPFGGINYINGYSPQESYPWLPEPGVGRSWSFTRKGYEGQSALYSLSGISSNSEISNYSYFGNVATLIISGELLHPFIDYTPHYGIEKNIGIGTTGIQISGSSVEKNTESYIGLGNLTFSGVSLESYSAQTPEDIQLFVISGISVEKNTESYVGLGTLTLSGISVEKNTESYVGFGTLTFSGVSAESDTNLYVGFGTLTFSGVSIERNTESYVGFGTLTFSEVSVERNTESYNGTGSITLSGVSLESYSAQTPEDTQLFQISGQSRYNLNLEYKTTETPPPITLFGQPLLHPDVDYTPHYGIEQNIGVGTTGIKFLRGVGFIPDSEGNTRDGRTYSNRYPINDKVPNTGIGTITFDQTRNIAKYSPLTPYTGNGLFNIITGYSPQESYPWIPEPGIGKSWSFTKSNYNGTGIISVSGIASTREIAVYGYYGNDKNPGTSGTIFISQQTTPSIEKEIDSYIGVGTYLISGASTLKESNAYLGSGIINISGTGLESLSSQIPENVQLFNISGSSFEVYSAQTPEIEVLYVISGSIIEKTSNSYSGNGSITLNGSARSIEIPNYPSRGLIRFVNHGVDNDYDTCDNQELTCDNQYSAQISFVVNTPENTILFEFGGVASTKEIATYEYDETISYIISGSYEKVSLTYSEIGLGTIFTPASSLEQNVITYVGSGNFSTLSGSSESYSTEVLTSTILIQIGGSADIRIELEYSVVGIGLVNIGGNSITRKISNYEQVGSGTLTLSGELIYPDIIFIPSPDGLGTINIIGSSPNSLTKEYENTSGTLFAFSSGFESLTESTYIGVGTIYIQEITSTSTNNSFQIPRTYIVII
jgi:hypothetical protein